MDLETTMRFTLVNVHLKSQSTRDNRDKAAARVYHSNMPRATLQKLLNHSNPSVTLRYIGISQDQLDDVYRRLNL